MSFFVASTEEFGAVSIWNTLGTSPQWHPLLVCSFTRWPDHWMSPVHLVFGPIQTEVTVFWHFVHIYSFSLVYKTVEPGVFVVTRTLPHSDLSHWTFNSQNWPSLQNTTSMTPLSFHHGVLCTLHVFSSCTPIPLHLYVCFYQEFSVMRLIVGGPSPSGPPLWARSRQVIMFNLIPVLPLDTSLGQHIDTRVICQLHHL